MRKLTVVRRFFAEIKESITQFLSNDSPIKEIEYFHPTGRSLPNGICYMKGGFIKECLKNSDTFIRTVDTIDQLLSLPDHQGGMIIFSIGHKAADNSKVADCIKDYPVGNFFQGTYIDHYGKLYDNDSLAVDINRLPSKQLMRLAKSISQDLPLEPFLLKDFNTNKIYLVGRNKGHDKNPSTIDVSSVGLGEGYFHAM